MGRSTGTRPFELDSTGWLLAPARVAAAECSPITCGLARYHELPQINGYPFHPSKQHMIAAAGIKDQSWP